MSWGREELDRLDDIGVVDPPHDLDFSAEIYDIALVWDGRGDRLYGIGLTDNRTADDRLLNIDALCLDDNAKLASMGEKCTQ